MAQHQITISDEMVREIFLRDNGLAKLVEGIVQKILEAQVAEHLRAGAYERTENRQGYRNGSRERKIATRVGTLTLSVPRVRDGSFSTELYSRYQRSEQALLLAMMEMVVNGVSTRKVTQITEELCGTSFSKSMVSSLCSNLDPIVNGWNERPLSDKDFPFLLVDAIVLRGRENGRVQSVSALIATGINQEGCREILGMKIGDSETYATWSEFFGWLKSRGLKGVDLVVSDDHGGLVKAVKSQFQGCSWQRCQTHFMRNILDATPKNLQAELHNHVRAILTAPDPGAARALMEITLELYQEKAPKAMTVLEEGFDDATAVLCLPEPCRKRLRTTNCLERLNQEIRRRERVIRIFPNRESMLRLLGALLMEQDETWASGRRYLDIDIYMEWKKEQQGKRTEVQTRVLAG